MVARLLAFSKCLAVEIGGDAPSYDHGKRVNLLEEIRLSSVQRMLASKLAITSLLTVCLLVNKHVVSLGSMPNLKQADPRPSATTSLTAARFV